MCAKYGGWLYGAIETEKIKQGGGAVDIQRDEGIHLPYIGSQRNSCEAALKMLRDAEQMLSHSRPFRS